MIDNKGDNAIGEIWNSIPTFSDSTLMRCISAYRIKNGNLSTFLRAMPVPRATARSGSSAM